MCNWHRNPVSCTSKHADNYSCFSIVQNIPRQIRALSRHIRIPHLSTIVSRFLYTQDNPDDKTPPNLIPLEDCPQYTGKIFVYPSAIAVYRAPSDMSSSRGFRFERIRSVSSWRGGPARRDCVFVEQDSSLPGFRGLFVGQIEAFLKLKHKSKYYSCAIMSTFSPIADSPCPDTGMWIVQRDLDENNERLFTAVHLDSIIRGAQLIGVAGDAYIPRDLQHTDSLNAFRKFYVNKYIDYHAHEIAW
jgi:hypothetical protein